MGGNEVTRAKSSQMGLVLYKERSKREIHAPMGRSGRRRPSAHQEERSHQTAQIGRQSDVAPPASRSERTKRRLWKPPHPSLVVLRQHPEPTGTRSPVTRTSASTCCTRPGRGACSGGRATSLGLPVSSRRPPPSLIPAHGRRKLGH